MLIYRAERREVAYFMRRLYRQKLTTASGGNISLRVDENTVAITPAATDKGRIRAREIALITLEGENLTPELKASSETRMHLRIFERCPWALAVVHAHPPTASAFTASATPIDCALISESYANIGQPVVAPYALTGTQELADIVAEAATGARVVLMQNHGLVATGTSLLQAFDLLELIEAAAKMTLVARQIGQITPLAPNQLKALDKLMGRE